MTESIRADPWAGDVLTVALCSPGFWTRMIGASAIALVLLLFRD